MFNLCVRVTPLNHVFNIMQLSLAPSSQPSIYHPMCPSLYPATIRVIIPPTCPTTTCAWHTHTPTRTSDWVGIRDLWKLLAKYKFICGYTATAPQPSTPSAVVYSCCSTTA